MALLPNTPRWILFAWLGLGFALGGAGLGIAAFGELRPLAYGAFAIFQALVVVLAIGVGWGWGSRRVANSGWSPVSTREEVHGFLELAQARGDQIAMLRLLESAVVHARDAVIILEAEAVDGRGRSVLYANDAFYQMSGYLPEEVLGRSLHFLRGPDTDSDTLDRLREALQAGEAFKAELLNYHKKGGVYWVELSVVPVPDPSGVPSHWVMIQRDVSDRKQSEEEIRQAGRLLRAIIDAFPGYLNAKDREGRYLVMNRAQAESYGLKPEEAVGRTIDELTPPDHAAQVRNWDELVLSTGVPFQVESEDQEPDGSFRNWLSTKVPLPGRPRAGGGHEIAGIVSVDVDVSELKRVQETLRQSEARLEDAQRIAHIGSWEYNPSTNVLVWSAEKYRILGYEPNTMVPSEAERASTIHPLDRDAVLRDGEDALAQRRAGTIDYRIVRPNGEIRYVHDEYYPVLREDGSLEAFRGVTHDITERRQTEQQFFQSQKMELVGQMAGGIAHDFNNLLTAIIGNLNLTQLPSGSSDSQKVEFALRAANRAADLTHKLLSFARKNQLSVAPVSVRDLVTDATDLLRRTFDPRVELVTELVSQSQVSVDFTLMSQVLLNLCINARDAMPAGGRLTIRTQDVTLTEANTIPEGRQGEFVCITVQDTGLGMPSEVRARIFEPFFTTKPIGKGTGLGLPMVQGTVHQHKGWITCDSTPDQGTRFDVYLPKLVEQAGSPRRSGIAGWVSRHTPERPVLPPRPPQDATILLVDDEDMIRMVARTVLESAGMTVLEATDGDEAVEVFEREGDRIDLIVLDLTMPRLSGRDACRAIRERRSDVRVLFSSGYSADEVSPEDGAIGLLSKPYRPQELLEAVARALAQEPEDSSIEQSHRDPADTPMPVSKF